MLGFCEFIAPQIAECERTLAAATAGQLKASILYQADGVVERVSPVDSSSKRYVIAILVPYVLRLYHYSLMTGLAGE